MDESPISITSVDDGFNNNLDLHHRRHSVCVPSFLFLDIQVPVSPPSLIIFVDCERTIRVYRDVVH